MARGAAVAAGADVAAGAGAVVAAGAAVAAGAGAVVAAGAAVATGLGVEVAEAPHAIITRTKIMKAAGRMCRRHLRTG